MIGYIGVYIHSDASIKNKAVGLAKVTCQTDFAARSTEFINFCNLVAQLAVGYDISDFQTLAIEVPSIEQERLKLQQATLKEEVKVEEILLSSLKDEPKLSAHERYKANHNNA